MFAALGAGDLRLGQIVNAAQEQIEPAPQQDELNLKMPSGTTIVNPRNSLEFKGVVICYPALPTAANRYPEMNA